MNRVTANSSLAHTVGNVTTLFTEFIKSLFPDNYFRHVHVNTRMAYREQKREENSKYEFIKKTRPILVIRPRVELNNDDIFLSNSFFTNNSFGQRFTGDSSNFLPFFYDKKSRTAVTYLMNRIRVIFDCTIMVDTEFEQINQYSYLLNIVPPNIIYRMDTALEVYIPQTIMELVSAYSGVPIKDPDTGTVKPYLDYVMGNANKYITFKERTSSSTMDFFMFYPCAIDYIFTDISKDDPSKKSWASYSCNINFSITTEFNTVGIYNFFTSKTPSEMSFQVDLGTQKDKELINIVPMFTISNLFDDVELPNGFKMFYSRAFETEPELAGKPDSVDFSGELEYTNAKDIIAWHNKNGIPNSVYIGIIIMENNKKLEEDKDYIVDWENLSVSILKSNPDKTYRLVMFMNQLYALNITENYNSISNAYEQQVGKITDKTINTKFDNEIGIK